MASTAFPSMQKADLDAVSPPASWGPLAAMGEAVRLPSCLRAAGARQRLGKRVRRDRRQSPEVDHGRRRVPFVTRNSRR
jgi:hypothetical protein